MSGMKIRAMIVTVAAIAAFPSAAAAHVEVSPGEAPAGKPVDLSFTVEHDCEGAATIGLDVKVPSGVADYSAKSIPGWKASTSAGRMKWKGGPQPEGQELSVPFRATIYGDMGDQFPFKVIQLCEGGVETAWIQTTGGEGEGDDPAPVLTLTSSKAAPAPAAAGKDQGTTGVTEKQEVTAASGDGTSAEEDSGGVGIGPIIGLILIVASITAFVIIRRGKRNTK
jgi:uncharacterized protein YcnI